MIPPNIACCAFEINPRGVNSAQTCYVKKSKPRVERIVLKQCNIRSKLVWSVCMFCAFYSSTARFTMFFFFFLFDTCSRGGEKR